MLLALEPSIADLEPLLLPPQIDRLSLLPNELLDYIFDLAYSIDTPSTGALSKHLLPFHITGIYCRIRISKYTAFLNLVNKVNEQPTLAISIQTLELVAVKKPTVAPPASTRYDLETFIRSLTRLQTLKIDKGYPQMSRILDPNSSLLYSNPLIFHRSVTFALLSLSILTSNLNSPSIASAR